MMKQMRIQRLPQRIQRSRQKGWKSPPNTIHATRPNRYGNRWLTAQEYEDMGIPALTEEDLETLLAADFISCWCAYTDDCHVSRIIHRLGRYLERKQRENSGESYLDKKMLMDAINTFAVQGERIRDRWLSYITFQKWSNSAEVSWDWLLETVSLLTPAVKAIIEVRALADQQEVYFDSSEQESLTETQLDHCVEKLLDADYESPEDWPDVLEVIRYRRMTAGSDSMNILEDTLEKLDVNFQSLDGYVQTEQTVSLKAARGSVYRLDPAGIHNRVVRAGQDHQSPGAGLADATWNNPSAGLLSQAGLPALLGSQGKWGLWDLC